MENILVVLTCFSVAVGSFAVGVGFGMIFGRKQA